MGTIDVLHGLQRPPGRRTIYYQTVNNTACVVGIAIIPLVPIKIICDEVFLQADMANLGIIEVGGLTLDGINGIQLDAGAAVVFNPISVGGQPGWLGQQVTGMTERMGGAAQFPRVVFNLADLRAFASIPAQLLRITYMQLVEVL
jgi:hypothetical protein